MSASSYHLAYETEEREASDKKTGNFVPPCRLLLDRLGLTETDLKKETVTVSAKYLRVLIQQFARAAPFDPEWYATRYPDVEGAVLAGDVPSLQEHFINAGYFEGRLPHELSFDPIWYHSHYKDIAAVFSSDDIVGMRNHYLTGGYYEGRVGTECALPLAEEWTRP
jgi:hypothetical protein